MNGIICVNKPKGYTSFDVVAIMKRVFGTKKIGHGGTLDPMAEGVLPIFVGAATKAVDFCPRDDKEYLAGFRLGMTTDTEDSTGKVLTVTDEYVSRNRLIPIENRYVGELLQTPPMYSAVQIEGVRLYDLARKGIEVERKPRKIIVSKLKIESYSDNEGKMRVACSKGTYIRTLIADIGKELGVGAVMTSLVRTRSGVFTLSDCHELSELQKLSGNDEKEKLEAMLLPLERLYSETPKALLDERQTELFRNGATLDANRVKFDKIYDGMYAVMDFLGRCAGLGKISQTHELTVLQRFAAVEIVRDGKTVEERRELFKDIHFTPID